MDILSLMIKFQIDTQGPGNAVGGAVVFRVSKHINIDEIVEK